MGYRQRAKSIALGTRWSLAGWLLIAALALSGCTGGDEAGTPTTVGEPGAARTNEVSALLESGEMEAAAELLEEALRLNPEELASLHRLGFALLGLGRYEDALEVFEREMALDSDFPDAWLGLALAHAGMGQHDQALDSLDEALRLDPDYEDALQARGALKSGP